MNVFSAASALVVVFVAAACAAPGGTNSPTTAPTVAVAPTVAAATRISVTLTDAMKIEPPQMTVRAGEAVTFVVTNTGQIDHEFTLGDEDVQADHEEEMLAMPGMAHDEENAISVEPGKTKELVYIFDEPGTTLAGCHVPGHYPAGMKATITIAS
jgi:uncharacterized cupredoxin-like copper-binding protein